MGRSKHRRTSRKAKGAKVPFDKYALYQRAVQEPEADIEFMDEIFEDRFGRVAHTLREDFCAAAFLSCEWVRARPENRAWGIDLDPEPLQWGRDNNAAALSRDALDRLHLIEGDVMDRGAEPVDVIAAFNFSYYFIKTRRELVRYFESAHANLAGKGMFVLDIYGGPEAQELVEETTIHDGFNYVWDQDEFDPINSRMVCYIHFEKPSGKRVLKRAFTYDWRLWSILEVREALHDAGFADTAVYWEGVEEESGEGDGEFVATEEAENTESWIAYLVGWKES